MQDDIHRIEKWADIFKHPFTLIPKLIKNTSANIDAIYQDIGDIISNVEKHDDSHLWMKTIGEDIAKILVLQLGPVPAAAAPASLPPIPKLPFSPMDVKMFVDGMLQVLIHRNDFTEIDHCFKDTTTIEKQLAQAVQDFEKKDVPDILAGVQVMGEILQEIPVQLGHCDGMQKDMARITAWADIFKHPMTLIPKVTKNTIANFPQIIKDTDDMVH